MWTGTFSVWSSQTVWRAGVDKPHPPVPHTLCLCGAANQKKAGAMNINSLWAVTRNICLSLLAGFCRVHVVVIYSRLILVLSDPFFLWFSAGSACWCSSLFQLLSVSFISPHLLWWCYIVAQTLVLISAHVSHPVLTLSQGQRALYNAEFTAVWCLSFVEYTLFHWGSNWELKNSFVTSKQAQPSSDTLPGRAVFLPFTTLFCWYLCFQRARFNQGND